MSKWRIEEYIESCDRFSMFGPNSVTSFNTFNILQIQNQMDYYLLII